MWTYGDSRAAIRDALRLSRAMTFKSAVAGLPLGGGKGVIMLPAGHAPPAGDDRRDVLLDFGDTVDSLGGAYVTAEDVGTSDRDMAVIAEATDHVAGLAVETGSSGDPSPWTALGVQCAMEVACERAFGSASLAGRSVAVVGLGRVGGKLARLLAEAGRRRSWPPTSTRASARSPTSSAPRWTDPDAALTADVDVLAPCALGGVLDDDTVPELKCRVIAGAANNQLAADAIAVQLADREHRLGARLRRQRRRHHQHRGRVRGRGLRRRRGPRSACAASPTPPARSSTTPTPPAPRRSPRRSRSPAGGSPRPARPRPSAALYRRATAAA